MKLLLFTPTNFFEIFSASIRKMAVLQLSYSRKLTDFGKKSLRLKFVQEFEFQESLSL